MAIAVDWGVFTNEQTFILPDRLPRRSCFITDVRLLTLCYCLELPLGDSGEIGDAPTPTSPELHYGM